MDDLLSLMAGPDEGEDVAEETISSSRDDENANGRSIHDEDTRFLVNTTNSSVNTRNAKSTSNSTGSSSSTVSSNTSKKDNTTVDSFTGIRIVSRQVSRVEIVDIFSQYQFHTTTVLASMSKYDLSKLCTDPNNDGSGKTCMVTMGICFENAKTRISSKSGRAFTIFKIGNDLSTGPTVSVFLFGHAYSKFVTKVKPGMVIAILASSIMPSKGDDGKQYGGDTRITLSIREEQQLLIVGNAVDFGICGATVGNKQWNNGQESSRCKNYVDLSVGKFCRFHAKCQGGGQKKATQGRSSKGQKGNMTFVQSLKANSSYNMKGSRGGSVIQSNAGTMVMPTKKVDIQKVDFSQIMPQRSGFSNSIKGVKDSLQMMSSKSQHPVQAKTLKLGTSSQLMKDHRNGSYSQFNTKAIVKPSVSKPNNDMLGKMINSTKQIGHKKTTTSDTNRRLNSTNTKKRRLQDTTQLSGFDGQVQIPRPNPLFNRAPSNPLQGALSRPSSKASLSSKGNDLNEILRKQKLLSQGIHSKKGNATNTLVSRKQLHNNNNNNSIDNMFGSSMDDETKAQILSTKSRFSNEADAELYARNRKAVTELEKKEGSVEKRQSKMKKTNNGASNAINTIWVCIHCKKTFSFKPQKCVASGHVLKKKREIKQREGTIDKRMKLKSRSVEDGGLQLGAGIEWSQKFKY